MEFNELVDFCTKEFDGIYKIPENDYDIEMVPDRRKGGFTERKLERLHYTKIPPNLRTIHNIPRDVDGQLTVDVHIWLLIDRQSIGDISGNYIGKSFIDDGWYGITRRGVYGYRKRDIIYTSTPGNETGEDFVIVDEDEAKELALNFVNELTPDESDYEDDTEEEEE